MPSNEWQKISICTRLNQSTKQATGVNIIIQWETKEIKQTGKLGKPRHNPNNWVL